MLSHTVVNLISVNMNTLAMTVGLALAIFQYAVPGDDG